MKSFIATLLLASLALPALAQQPPQAPAAPGQQAWEILYQRELAAHHNDLGAAIQLKGQVDELQAKVADLQKQLDAKKPEAPK